MMHFWWFEFGLRSIPLWTFEKYLFVLGYTGVYFFLCTLLFPDSLEDYTGYQDYFLSRRSWFFGLLGLLYAADVIDTLIKGNEHFEQYGIEYPIRIMIFIALCITGATVKNPRFHAVLATVALIYETTFMLRHFSTLS